jgi:HTH-type transcriptional regulator/antitoxin HigA
MDMDPAPGTQKRDELEVWGLVIKQYEDTLFLMNMPTDPVGAIKYSMGHQGLKKKDLIPYIGPVSKVTEVLNGTRNLSLRMIRRLNDGLKIPVDVLIQPVVKRRA